MIPTLMDIGAPAPWPVLPPGVHDATLADIAQRFATTPHRQRLFNGFVRAADALRLAGCRTVYLDGSFVTGKPHPGDFDGCWEIEGVDPTRIDPVLLTFENQRQAQKAKYLGEMFIAHDQGAPGRAFLEFLQVEKFSGRTKGILRVRLASEEAGI